jgi:ssDNA-binding replication factor A large subunit
MSGDFKTMVELLLERKPEISAEEIKNLVEEKKRRIGAGYLTDQGALFLVAADLGISLERVPASSFQKLKDLYVGARDTIVVSRVMSIYPTRTFTRRDKNEEVRNRTLAIFDGDITLRLKLWEKKVEFPEESGLRPGDLIKLTKGYVKSGLDGKPILNIGDGGTVEIFKDSKTDIPTLDQLACDISQISDQTDNAIVFGKISSSPRVVDYRNIRAQEGKALQFNISNEEGSRTMRCIVWNISEARLPKILTVGTTIRLVGVKVKHGNVQYGSSDLEIHGDEGTTLEPSTAGNEPDVLSVKLISVGKDFRTGYLECLALEKNGKIIELRIDSNLLNSPVKSGTIIQCIPSIILGNQITLSRDDSYVSEIDDDESSFPPTETLESKIVDITNSDRPYLVEGIVLQTPSANNVTTRNGESISLAETILGDDTGEISFIGWRELSSLIKDLKVGERVKALGVIAKNGRDGRLQISLKPYSSIKQIG